MPYYPHPQKALIPSHDDFYSSILPNGLSG